EGGRSGAAPADRARRPARDRRELSANLAARDPEDGPLPRCPDQRPVPSGLGERPRRSHPLIKNPRIKSRHLSVVGWRGSRQPDQLPAPTTTRITKTMTTSIFSGTLPALMTPCKEDRTPDFDALVRKAQQLMEHRMTAAIYAGSMGDWPLLTDAE